MLIAAHTADDGAATFQRRVDTRLDDGRARAFAQLFICEILVRLTKLRNFLRHFCDVDEVLLLVVRRRSLHAADNLEQLFRLVLELPVLAVVRSSTRLLRIFVVRIN